MPVRGAVAKDTKKNLDGLLNSIGKEFGVDPVYLLGGAVIGEGVWNEHAIRLREWPDVSYGFSQPSVAWCEIPGMKKSADPRYRNADTVANRENARVYFWDAERALRYCAVRYAALFAKYQDPVEAWCRWNKPNIPGKLNPNRPTYIKALDEAEAFRVEEGDMPIDLSGARPKRSDFRTVMREGQVLADYLAGEEYKKSMLEYAFALELNGQKLEAAQVLAELNNVKYGDLPKA